MLDATWEPSSGREIGRRLAADPSVTAVFCGNDEIAMGVIRGLADEGLGVPSDVSIVGFDDHPLAEMWSPSLTTVRQDFADLGKRAVALLVRGLDGMAPRGGSGRPPLSTGRPQLVVRESAGPPSVRRG